VHVGGVEEGSSGSETHTKAIIAIAVEIYHPKGFGLIRVKRVRNVSSAGLTPFVCQAIEPKSTVHTAGWKGYNDLPKHGYKREVTVLAASDDAAHIVMPGMPRIASLLKRWLPGTHQGAVSNRHLDYYLDEYTFRFNHRTSTSRGLLFHRLLQQSASTPKTPYRSLVGGSDAVAAGRA
jgi:transposase-like protein